MDPKTELYLRLSRGEISQESYDLALARLEADEADGASPPPAGSGPEPAANPYAAPRAAVDGAQGEASGPRSFWDKQFGDTSTAILVLAAICCGCPAFLFSIGGLIGCKEPEAKRKAHILFWVSLGWMVVSTIIRLAMMAQEGQFQP